MTLTAQQAQVSILGKGSIPAKPVTHLSYSGKHTHEACPKQYELSYVTGAPKQGAVWFVGGSAVHAMTEQWDHHELSGEPLDLQATWKRVFNETLDKAKEADPDVLNWRRAGVKKDNPQGEDIAHWYSVLGPQLVQAYIGWRRRANLEIWVTPDGQPAIELDVCGTLPGMPEGIEFKGFIDRIFYDPHLKTLTIVDLKTGTRKPENSEQFGIYGAAVQHRYGVAVPFGAAFMNRQGSLSEAHNLSRYTPEYVGRNFGRLHAAITAGYFNPVIGRHCGMCSVSAACYANGGPLADRFDRDFPGNQPGF